MTAKSITRKPRTVVKYTFKQLIEKRQADLEEVKTANESIQTLISLLSLTIEDEDSATVFNSSEYQRKIPILKGEDFEFVKSKIFFLIKKYYK